MTNMETTPEPPVDLESKVAEAARIQDWQEQIVAAIKTVYDPEIPVNIYELGLIYGIAIEPDGAVHVKMTLTSPGCPAAGSLPPEVEGKVKGVAGVTSAKVEVVWEPTWEPSRMSDAAKLQLGMDDW
jgi:FeS assembly SUF system protein